MFFKESQLAGGKPVGYLQVQLRSWTRDYQEQPGWLERVMNPGSLDLKASALTKGPHCLPQRRRMGLWMDKSLIDS